MMSFAVCVIDVECFMTYTLDLGYLILKLVFHCLAGGYM